MSDSSGGATTVKVGAAVDWMAFDRNQAGGGTGGGAWSEFGKGFAASANFGTAVIGAGFNAITAGAGGRIKGTFG